MERKSKNERSKKVYIPLIIVVAIVLGFGGYYYWQYLHYESTDDAVVDGNSVALGSKVMARIAKIYADEGDTVVANQLLIELDSADLQAQINQAEANVSQMQVNIIQAEAKLKAETENIKILEINADKAKVDYDRACKQKEADVITQESFENYKKAYQTTNAQLTAAQAQLKVVKAQVESAIAAVNSGKAQVEVLSTQMRNMHLYSPFNGIIAKRWLLAGDIAQPGQTILTINNSENLWVSVYIEETKLKNIRLGQDAIFNIDAFPGITFYGKVILIGNNTASRFSLIPPSNASGNFTKITQRIQLKLSIEKTSKGNLSEYSLLPGMSCIVKLVK